jgi:hypothetical protein
MTEKDLEKKWEENSETSSENISFIEPQESKDIEVDIGNEEVFDDDSEIGSLLTSEKYEIPKDESTFVDTGEGKIIKKEDMAPFEIIKLIAKENGVEIKDPKKNCNHCYGRGYEAFDSKTKMPVPCRCLFRGRNHEQDALYDSNKLNKSFSRIEKRRMAKNLRKHFKIQRNILKRKQENGLPIETEEKEVNNREINKILKEYIKLNSLKDTAKSLGKTLTFIKKIVKDNREKLENLKKKAEK